MDVQVPEMDGHEATRRLQAREGYSAPIVGLTAAAASDVLQCIDAGMDDVVTKPLKIERMAGTFARHLRG